MPVLSRYGMYRGAQPYAAVAAGLPAQEAAHIQQNRNFERRAIKFPVFMY
jgi:hypothetical protein